MGKNKKAAMEMSVGTIVTVVLLMTVLILGLVLVQKIYGGATNIVDMTSSELEDQVTKLFSDEDELVIYPSKREIEVKQTEQNGFGIGIKNLLTGSGTKTFSYDVSVSSLEQCEGSTTEEEIESWLIGKSEEDIPIPTGKLSVQKTLIDVPIGSPLCTFKLRINVDAEGTAYATDFIYVKIREK